VLAAARAASPAALVADGDAEAIAWLAYTGGTTGRSKGVMIPHRALTTMAAVICADWDWPHDIRYLAVTPISHAAGVTIFPVMLRGGYTRLAQGFDAEAFCDIVNQEQINATFLVPTLIYRLIDEAALRARYDLSSLDLIVYGAAPMSPDRLLEAMRIFGRVFLQLYGQTEAPQCVTCLRKIDHDPSRPERLGSCGRPNPLVDVRLSRTFRSPGSAKWTGKPCGPRIGRDATAPWRKSALSHPLKLKANNSKGCNSNEGSLRYLFEAEDRLSRRARPAHHI
jgi:fatty-acyl-CoA synthase